MQIFLFCQTIKKTLKNRVDSVILVWKKAKSAVGHSCTPIQTALITISASKGGIKQFFSKTKKENQALKNYLIIFLISMIPIVELRGAIPVAVGMGMQGTELVWAYIVCVIGNMLPVPFIFFFARKVLEWGKDKKYIGKFFTFCIQKGEKGGQKLQAKAGRGLFVALMLFVGIPLPGTGAWTGTLAASFLDMDFKKSVIAVMCGVIIAGIIMGLASMGVFGGLSAIFAPKQG